jgi:hypothetical protein
MPHMEYMNLNINRDDYGKSKVELIEKIRQVKKNPNPELITRGRIYYKQILDRDNYKKIIYTILEKGRDFIWNPQESEK